MLLRFVFAASVSSRFEKVSRQRGARTCLLWIDSVVRSRAYGREGPKAVLLTHLRPPQSRVCSTFDSGHDNGARVKSLPQMRVVVPRKHVPLICGLARI